jgi:hypothetical protein
MTLDQLATYLGYAAMSAGGIAVVGGIFLWAAVFARRWAWRLWEEMATIYRLETMRYWFTRMQDKGCNVMREEHSSVTED